MIASRSAFRQGGIKTPLHIPIRNEDRTCCIRQVRTDEKERWAQPTDKSKENLSLQGYIKRANKFLMLVIDIDRNEEQKNDLG